MKKRKSKKKEIEFHLKIRTDYREIKKKEEKHFLSYDMFGST